MSTRWIKHLAIFCGAWFALSASMGGCHCTVQNHHTHHPSPIYVGGPPPASKAETKPAAPSADHVWVDGHWEWNGADDDWDWIPGSWQLPPAGGWVWEGGSYEESDAGGIYTPGHWVQLEAKSDSKSDSKGKLGIGDSRPETVTKAESKPQSKDSAAPGSETAEPNAESGVKKAEGHTVDLEAQSKDPGGKTIDGVKKSETIEVKKGSGGKTIDGVKKSETVEVKKGSGGKKIDGLKKSETIEKAGDDEKESKKKVKKGKVKATKKKAEISAKGKKDADKPDKAPQPEARDKDTDVVDKIKKIQPRQKRPTSPIPNTKN